MTGLTGIVNPAGAASESFGTLQLFFAAIIVALAIVGMSGKPLLAVLLGVAGAQSVLGGIFGFTAAEAVDDASGILGLVLAGFALYGGLALLLEDTRQRQVLPILRRSISERALEGSLDEQLARAEREAGVRQQL